jgi:hypothetical protein
MVSKVSSELEYLMRILKIYEFSTQSQFGLVQGSQLLALLTLLYRCNKIHDRERQNMRATRRE